MHDYTFSSFAKILSVMPIQQVSDPVIEHLLTDSRKLLVPESTVFFGISSYMTDAGQFIEPLYLKGVRCFITAGLSDKDLARFPEANFIITEDVLGSLQDKKRF